MKETVSKYASYTFTDEELLKIGKDLSLKSQDLRSLENEKKAVMSEFKSKIDACASEIDILSNHVANGFHMKKYTCEIKRDFAKGIKEFIDVSTGEVIATEKLTGDDHQLRLSAE